MPQILSTWFVHTAPYANSTLLYIERGQRILKNMIISGVYLKKENIYYIDFPNCMLSTMTAEIT